MVGEGGLSNNVCHHGWPTTKSYTLSQIKITLAKMP